MIRVGIVESFIVVVICLGPLVLTGILLAILSKRKNNSKEVLEEDHISSEELPIDL